MRDRALAAAARLAGAGAGAARSLAWRLHAYGAPDDLRLEEARVPPLRAPDDVLVRVLSASVNPLDVAMIGGYGSRALNALRALEGGEGVEFPLTVGRDFVGEVVRAGPAARLRTGRRAWGVLPPQRAGAHAQHVLVRDACAGAAPAALGAAAGGALYAGLTACSLLRAAGLREASGARVLLLGLGGVGQAALQLLARRGARVDVGCARDLLPLAAELGAADAWDRHATDYDERLASAPRFDAILDCAGLGGDEAGARRWRFGRYVTLSSPLLRETDAHGLLAGSLRAGGALLAQSARASRASPAGPPPHVRWAYFVPCAADIEMLRRLAEHGQWRVPVERVYGWWEAREALRRAGQGSARGKLVLDFAAHAPPL